MERTEKRTVLGRRAWLQGGAAVAFGQGCAAPPGSAQEIRVGAFLSLSGEETQFGLDSQQAIELATEETNAAGGIRGRRVRVLSEDDRSNAQETTRKVRQLIDRNHVVALLGEVSSSRSLAGGLIANAKKIPMISPSSTNIKVTQRRPYVFRVCFTDEQQSAAAAELIIGLLGKKRIAILYASQDPYSSGLTAWFRAAARARGGEIVVEKGFQKGEKNFRTYLRQLRDVNPDMIFAPVYYNDMVPIAQQAREAGLDGSLFVGGDGWDAMEILDGAGAELEGAYFVNHYAPDVPWNESKRFLTVFQARYGRLPTGLNAQAYDAAKLLYDAMGRVNVVEPQGLRNAIAATRAYRGVTGSITIDENRNAKKPAVIVQIKNRAFHYFATVGETT